MFLEKCPRCDLNYIMEGEKYCKVCQRELRGDSREDEIELCSICNEAPALPGRDVCLFCLKEMNGSENNQEEDEDGIVVTEDAAIGIDPLSTMDEIIPETDGEDDGTMSLEALGEEEEEEDDLDEDDPDADLGGRRRK